MNETQNLGLLRYFLVHSVGATETSEACQRIAAHTVYTGVCQCCREAGLFRKQICEFLSGPAQDV